MRWPGGVGAVRHARTRMGTQRLSVVVGKRVAVMNVEVKIIRRQGHMLISDFELTLKKFTATTNAETNMTSY
jgi:hypothetical protein